MKTLKQLEDACAKDPVLNEKYHSELTRLIESGEAADELEAIIKAADTVGFKIDKTDLERAAAQMEELDDDSLDQVSGGRGFLASFSCNINYSFRIVPPKKKSPLPGSGTNNTGDPNTAGTIPSDNSGPIQIC